MPRNSTYGTKILSLKNQITRLEKSEANLLAKLDKKQNKINKLVKQKKKYQVKLSNVQRPYTRKQSRYDNRIQRINQRNMRYGQNIHRNRDRLRKNQFKHQKNKYAIREPYISKLVKDSHRKNGYFIRHRIYPLIHITETSTNSIVEMIRGKYQ